MNNKQAQRVAGFLSNKDVQLFKDLQEIQDDVKPILDILSNVDFTKIDTLQGEKGEKGDPEKGDKGDQGIQGLKGDKGDSIIGSQGPIGPKGESIIGPKGNDGSPDMAEDIRNKLELLTGDERLDKSAIKGLESVKGFVTQENMERAISIVDNRTSFLINKINNLPSPTSGASLPSQVGNNGKFLTTDGSTASWGTPAGSGNVNGPASATDGNVVLFDGTTGKLIKDSGLTLAGTNTGDQTITLTGGVTGSGVGSFAATVITNANLTGDITSVGNATTLTNAPVIAKVLTGYTSGAGTVAATDSILQAIQKLNGNDATNANLTGPVTSVGNATAIANGAISNAMLANGAVANLSGTNTGDQTTVSGNAGTATALQNARTIAGVSFNGTANIAIPASGLSNGVTGSGAVVLATSPTITTAVLGSSTATTQTPADNSTKIATTAYVDAAILGQNFKEAALVATTANLVGAYLSGVFTYTATGTDTIDGVTLALGNRVLVKNQTTTFQNGIYTVTTAGALGIAGVLTRSSDANTSVEFETGDSIFVTSGTAQSATTWAYTGVDSPTIGTDAITYVQAAGQGSFTSGNGITITGNSIAINTSVTVDKTTVQVLTNKDLSSGTNTFPTFNQNTSGSAATLTTPRSIYGNNFDGSAALAQIIASTFGGTGNGFTKFSGPTTSEKTKTLRDATDTILELGGSYTPTGTWTSLTMVTPVLGTPTSGTLTNCTGLPVAGITASTSTALGVGSIELGNASDTTLSRSAGGVLAVEGVVIPSISSTNTLTNKRVTKRVTTTTQSATPTINTDNTDVAAITALAQAITSMTTNLSGTPVAGDSLIIEITDNGTARAITWGTSFEASTVALPTTTVISVLLTVGFRWNTTTSKWRCVASA